MVSAIRETCERTAACQVLNLLRHPRQSVTDRKAFQTLDRCLTWLSQTVVSVHSHADLLPFVLLGVTRGTRQSRWWPYSTFQGLVLRTRCPSQVMIFWRAGCANDIYHTFRIRTTAVWLSRLPTVRGARDSALMRTGNEDSGRKGRHEQISSEIVRCKLDQRHKMQDYVACGHTKDAERIRYAMLARETSDYRAGCNAQWKDHYHS